MYCECVRPNKKNQEANGQTFTVCAKSLGGCGKEVKSRFVTGSKAKLYIDGVEVGISNDVSYTVNMDANLEGLDCSWFGSISGHFPVPVKLCETCEDDGFTMKCYGGHPIEAKCEICNGDGYVED